MKTLRELLAVFGLLSAIFLVVFNYRELPQRIPTHFGANGLANGWGDKSTLWVLVAVVAFDYILLSLIRFLPQGMINLPVRPEQRAAALPLAFAMIDWIKAESTCLFAAIVHAMISVATGQSQGLGLWFLPVTLLVIFATCACYIARMARLRG